MPSIEAMLDAQTPEFVVMTDGIGVKAQKPARSRAQPTEVAAVKRHETDVMIVPRRDGSVQTLCEGVSGAWSLVEATRAFLSREWAGAELPVVAISDGAKNIRCDLCALFGPDVRIVLDWYHLKKRVYAQLSMAARGREQHHQWQQALLELLWHGHVEAALAFVRQLSVRNARAQADLMGYIEKHAHEIINYDARQLAGKPVGSGRIEKRVDQVIGRRQKGKGMSWTQKGSRALALIKVAELNHTAPACSG